MSDSKNQSPVFVDASGGGLAALAAGVARLVGRSGAVAATSSEVVAVPSEVIAVLAEIGAHLPPVARLADVKPEGEVIRLATWPIFLLAPTEGELERLSAARIARDKIERRLSASS